MPKVTLITGHYWDSKRKAGFHHLANAFQDLGYNVLFFTAPASKLHAWKNDHLMQYPIKEEANKLIQKNALWSYVHYTSWHVANTRFKITNTLTSPFAKFYASFPIAKEAMDFIQESSYIIFESTPGLLLFDKIKSISPSAKYIYRVSDDLRFLNVHPALIKYEEKVLPAFDLVSIVSARFFNLFRRANVKLHFHGINKKAFSEPMENPYSNEIQNLVFIGNAYFDYSFLEKAASLFPEIFYHIIGPLKDLPKRSNIVAYGELPFKETIKYVKHANAGLHTLEQTKGAEAFTDTLKVHQYTYCKLPIIAPSFLKSNRRHAFYYQSGDPESIKTAVENALSYPHEKVESGNVLDWQELAQKLLED